MNSGILDILKIVIGLYVIGLSAFIGMLWKRQDRLFEAVSQLSKELSAALTEASKEHNEKLIVAVNEVGKKVSANTRELWNHLREREDALVRHDHLKIQLDPIRDNIGLLRKESELQRAESERRHNERAAEHKELVRLLSGQKDV